MITRDTYAKWAEGSLRGGSEWQAAVIDRAYRDQSNIFHAAYEIALEGRVHTCRICGGYVDPMYATTNHPLCAARRERHLPTPRVDWEPTCGCAKCNPR